MAEVDVLYTLGHDILDAVNTGFSNNGLTLPERQYVTFGDQSTIVWDCDQLVVSCALIYTGLPGGEVSALVARSNPILHTVQYHIQLVRCCYPGLKDGPDPIPSANEIDSVSADYMTDGWVLRSELVKAYKAQTLFSCCCDTAIFGRLDPVEPRGGCHGWTQTIEANIT